ncbi:MAG: hypothetical protein GC159_05760 [Phycisphaera sp.]|nr:hypothetical protein [Phycisphaera sp.]
MESKLWRALVAWCVALTGAAGLNTNLNAAEPVVSDVQVESSVVIQSSDGDDGGVVVEVDGDPSVLSGLEVIGPEVQARISEKLAERLGPEAAAKIQQRMNDAYLKQYDRDGDGKVSDAERQAVQQEWRDKFDQARRDAEARRDLREWDKDHDGILSDSEKKAKEDAEKARAEKLAKENASIIEKYDADKDGKLSGDEVSVMNAKLGEMLEQVRLIEQLATTGDNRQSLTYSPIRETLRSARMQQFRRMGPANMITPNFFQQ